MKTFTKNRKIIGILVLFALVLFTVFFQNLIPSKAIRVNRIATKYSNSKSSGTYYYWYDDEDTEKNIYYVNTNLKDETVKLISYNKTKKIGLDIYGTIWFQLLDDNLYWYNYDILNEDERNGGIQPLQINNNNVVIKDLVVDENNML